MQVAPDVNQSPSLLTLYAYVYLSRAALSHLVIDDIHVGVTDRKKRSWELGSEVERCALCVARTMLNKRVSLALASMARDDPPASSTASSTAPASSTAAAMRCKVGSEFET